MDPRLVEDLAIEYLTTARMNSVDVPYNIYDDNEFN